MTKAVKEAAAMAHAALDEVVCLRSQNASLRDTCDIQRNQLASLERELAEAKQEREKRDEHGQTPADYEDLGQSFLEEYYSVQDDPAMKDFICADSPVEIISHLLNAVAQAKAQMRTPGTREVCVQCERGTRHKFACNRHACPMERPRSEGGRV